MDVPAARRGGEPPGVAVRGAARRRPSAPCRGAPRQRARLPVLARGRRALRVGRGRHQLHVPRRAARDCSSATPTASSSSRRPSRSALLDGVDTGVADDQVLVVDDAEYGHRLRGPADARSPSVRSPEDDLFLLIFTSGSTGLPKARPLHAGPLRPVGRARAERSPSSRPATSVYSPLPFFHSSSLFTGWSSALNAGVPIATRPRFSASGTLPDIRRYGATMLTYTGKVLELHPRHTRAARRRRLSVAARDRQRGVEPRHPRVRAPLRLRRPRQLRRRRRGSSSSVATRRCPKARSVPANRR